MKRLFYLLRVAEVFQFAALLLIAFGAGAQEAALRFKPAEPMPQLDALFQRTNGWIGADGDYSAAVSPQRTLWFFSDTQTGSVIGEHRTNVTLINNSVGVQTGHGADAKVEFYYGKNADGKPAAWLTPADGRGWFWPVGCAFTGGKVRVFLWQMERAGNKNSAFGFRHAGLWLGTIENPQDAPAAWRVTQTKLPFIELTDARHAVLGSAVLLHDGFLYVFGTLENPKESFRVKQMIVARVKAGVLDDFSAWRFFRGGEWVADFREAAPAVRGVASEYSVSFCKATGGFILVSSADFLSPDIVARTAPQPWGPWSAPAVVHRCPEAAWRKDIFCYAAKAHAELSEGNELILTYAANSRDFFKAFTDAKIYWPRFVRVRFEPAK